MLTKGVVPVGKQSDMITANSATIPLDTPRKIVLRDLLTIKILHKIKRSAQSKMCKRDLSSLLLAIQAITRKDTALFMRAALYLCNLFLVG